MIRSKPEQARLMNSWGKGVPVQGHKEAIQLELGQVNLPISPHETTTTLENSFKLQS